MCTDASQGGEGTALQDVPGAFCSSHSKFRSSGTSHFKVKQLGREGGGKRLGWVGVVGLGASLAPGIRTLQV